MTARVTYRRYQEADIPGLLRLWMEETPWGSLTAEEWRQWYVETPFGEACVVVAVDEDKQEILGQFVFTPSLVQANRRQLRALRPSAPIVGKDLLAAVRDANPDEHPVAAMYRFATKVLQNQGYDLIYMLPDPRWLRALQLVPGLLYGSFPLWSIPLPLPAPLSLGPGYSATPLRKWDQRVDMLWEKASTLHGCLVVRDARSLPWKVGGGFVLGIEKNGDLVGLAASQAKGERQWLIGDMLAVDTGAALRATLAAAANLAHTRVLEAPPESLLRKVALLVNPALEPVTRALGFARDAYDFPLVIHILNGSVSEKDVAPERWYASAND
jgi:hypothetical protein